jgi:hypothetical protein
VPELLRNKFHDQVKNVLEYWISYDIENLFRIKCGIPRFRVPYEYETNTTNDSGVMEQGGPFRDDLLQHAHTRLEELMRCITTHHYREKDMVSATIYAMALRRLSPEYVPGKFTPHDTSLHGELNRLFGMEPPTYRYQACDSLLGTVKDRLAQHGIADSPPPAVEP